MASICRTLKINCLCSLQAEIQSQTRRGWAFQTETQISAPGGESYFSTVVVQVVLNQILSARGKVKFLAVVAFRFELIMVMIKRFKKYSWSQLHCMLLFHFKSEVTWFLIRTLLSCRLFVLHLWADWLSEQQQGEGATGWGGSDAAKPQS